MYADLPPRRKGIKMAPESEENEAKVVTVPDASAVPTSAPDPTPEQLAADGDSVVDGLEEDDNADEG